MYTKLLTRATLVVAYEDGYPADALEITGKEMGMRAKSAKQFAIRSILGPLLKRLTMKEDSS